MGAPLGPLKPDVRYVVLPATVGAARDVDPHPAHIGQARLFEGLADIVGQAPALGDGQVAGVGPRAGDDVPGQLGARFGHADSVQPAVKLGELVGLEVAEGEVLAVGDPDARSQLPLYSRQLPELGRGDVAQPGIGDGGNGALGHADHDVGRFPALVGVTRAEAQRDRRTHRAWAKRQRPRPPGHRPAPRTTAGMPPGQVLEARSSLRSFRIRWRSSSIPIVSTTHFSRARSLLSRLP